MNIGIDISQIVYETGVSVYTENLVSALIKYTNDSYVLYGGSLRRQAYLREFGERVKGHSVRSVISPLSPSLAHKLFNAPYSPYIDWFIGKLDVWHSSDWTQPRTKAYSVTTIHDLAPLLHPDLTPKAVTTVHQTRLHFVQKRADAIIVPTHAVAKDLAANGFEESKIRVIPEATDPIYTPQSLEAVTRVREKYGIAEPYFLGIGVGKRKNTARIVKAFEEFSKKHNGYTMVFTGRASATRAREKDVKYLGHVEKGDLPALYTGAEAIVYPSLYEGFGLPILEGFACQAPVITSALGSMEEVSKGAALLVDPYHASSIANGMKDIIKNRSTYIKKGNAVAKTYSWQATAQLTHDVYLEALTYNK